MKIISVLNQKGGAGKTTIATNLARALQLQGNDVILIDSDPQGSAMDWAAAHEDNPVEVYSIDKPILEKSIKKLKKDWIIVDGAPQVHDLAVSAIKAADLVLIPVQPSPYDIWSTQDLVEMVKQRIEITEGVLKAAFVISRAIRGTKISHDITEILLGYGLPVLTARTHQRVIYPSSAATGGTVFDECLDGEAAKEIRGIMQECIDYLI